MSRRRSGGRYSAGPVHAGIEPGWFTHTIKRGGRIVMRTTRKWGRKAAALASARRIARDLNRRLG